MSLNAIPPGGRLRMSKPSGQRRRRGFLVPVLNARLFGAVAAFSKADAMDYDDSEKDGRRGLDAADPLPPDDWAGFGSSARAEALYAAQRPLVAGIFRRNVPPQEVADLVQETFRRVFSAKGHGAGLLDAPAAYLAAAARSVLRNRARSGARSRVSDHHSFEEQEIAGPDPHAALEARDMIRRAEQAIARLGTTTQNVFLMHRFENLSYEEIARINGMSIKRVEKHISKARVAIRKARDAEA